MLLLAPLHIPCGQNIRTRRALNSYVYTSYSCTHPVISTPRLPPSPGFVQPSMVWRRGARWVGTRRGTNMARFLIPPVENRACGRVGRQRVTPTGTFPTAPLRTDRDSF